MWRGKKAPLMGLEPTTFELEVQCASITPQGQVLVATAIVCIYVHVHT